METRDMIRKTLSLAAISVVLAACANQPVNFASMSEGELLAYNRDKPVMDQIYCEDRQARTGSHIRRKECRTVQDWVYHNFRTQQAIQTMSVGRPFN